MKIPFLFASITIFLLVGCGGGLDPKTVAVKYWEAVKADDKEAAKAYVTKASIEKIDQSKTTKKKFDPEKMNASVGEATVQADQNKATVATEMTMKEEGRELKMNFDTVVVQEEGAWKVDLNLTTQSMSKSAFGMGMQGIQKGTQGEGVKMYVDPKTGKTVMNVTPEDIKKFEEETLKNKELYEQQAEEMRKKAEEMKKKYEEMGKKYQKKEE